MESFASDVRKTIQNDNAEIWVGVVKGKIGEAWPPCLRII